MRPSNQSRINDPELSQPICTALQLALVDLWRAFGLWPTAVAGHSSGEIAAAYVTLFQRFLNRANTASGTLRVPFHINLLSKLRT